MLAVEEVTVFKSVIVVSDAVIAPEFVSVNAALTSSHVSFDELFTLSVPLNQAICLSDPTRFIHVPHVAEPVEPLNFKPHVPADIDDGNVSEYGEMPDGGWIEMNDPMLEGSSNRIVLNVSVDWPRDNTVKSTNVPKR